MKNRHPAKQRTSNPTNTKLIASQTEKQTSRKTETDNQPYKQIDQPNKKQTNKQTQNHATSQQRKTTNKNENRQPSKTKTDKRTK